jgi:hypothetical protein
MIKAAVLPRDEASRGIVNFLIGAVTKKPDCAQYDVIYWKDFVFMLNFVCSLL